MKLINDELKARFKEIGSQSETLNPIIITKYFDSLGSTSWFATEYDEETNIAFGYVTGLQFDEWGSFSIAELNNLGGYLGKRIERDLYFQEKHFYEEFPELNKEKRMKDLDIFRTETFTDLDIDS